MNLLLVSRMVMVWDSISVLNMAYGSIIYLWSTHLHDLRKKSGGKLDESDFQKYTRMIVKGLRCINKKGYVHCDLKPENIIVFSSPNGASSIKITDFGLSKITRDLYVLVTKRFDF
jgi:serine/threonine protein kinase